MPTFDYLNPFFSRSLKGFLLKSIKHFKSSHSHHNFLSLKNHSIFVQPICRCTHLLINCRRCTVRFFALNQNSRKQGQITSPHFLLWSQFHLHHLLCPLQQQQQRQILKKYSIVLSCQINWRESYASLIKSAGTAALNICHFFIINSTNSFYHITRYDMIWF